MTSTITFARVAEDWLREVVRGRQRKAREVEADLCREFIPRWGNRPITEITALDVRDAIKEVKDRAPLRLGICSAMPSGFRLGGGAARLRHRPQPGRAA